MPLCKKRFIAMLKSQESAAISSVPSTRPSASTPFPFLKLPAELRNRIYALVTYQERGDLIGPSTRMKSALFGRVSRQIRKEYIPIFHSIKPLYFPWDGYHVHPPARKWLAVFGNERVPVAKRFMFDAGRSRGLVAIMLLGSSCGVQGSLAENLRWLRDEEGQALAAISGSNLEVVGVVESVVRAYLEIREDASVSLPAKAVQVIADALA